MGKQSLYEICSTSNTHLNQTMFSPFLSGPVLPALSLQQNIFSILSFINWCLVFWVNPGQNCWWESAVNKGMISYKGGSSVFKFLALLVQYVSLRLSSDTHNRYLRKQSTVLSLWCSWNEEAILSSHFSWNECGGKKPPSLHTSREKCSEISLQSIRTGSFFSSVLILPYATTQ